MIHARVIDHIFYHQDLTQTHNQADSPALRAGDSNDNQDDNTQDSLLASLLSG